MDEPIEDGVGHGRVSDQRVEVGVTLRLLGEADAL